MVDLERKNGQLNLAVQRFGKGKPSWLEIVADRERRPPAVQRQARLQYQRLLGHSMQRAFPDWNVDGLATTTDLERSFSPVYTRGLLRRGRSAICLLGVNDSELQASADGALTFALLWFHYCREREATRSAVEAQGLDYWSRVKWHHEREEFHRFGYFIETNGAAHALSPESPLLLLVAPALHIHPATDTILRYLSPELGWTLIAVDQRWREEVKVVFRKRAHENRVIG